MIRHAAVDGPRPVTPADYADTIALCNRVLRPHGPATIAEEYPCVLAPANSAHMWIIKSDGRVASHAATYASTMELEDGTQLRLGGISSVSTDPDARHRGYAAQVIDACCADLRAQGCHFAVLWTEIKGFYERFDFALLGSELLYRVTAGQLIPAATDAEIRPFAAPDLEELMALRAAVRPYTRRTPEQWAAYLGIPKTEVWVAVREGRIAAYTVVGKGEDFRNCAHEWAGPEGDVLAIIADAAARAPRRELIVLTPDDTGPVNRALQQCHAPNIRIELGMFRCLDPAGALEAARPAIEARAECALEVEQSGDRWTVRVDGETAGALDAAGVAALVLGQPLAHTLFPQAPAVAKRLERALPLPVFIWGLDSV